VDATQKSSWEDGTVSVLVRPTLLETSEANMSTLCRLLANTLCCLVVRVPGYTSGGPGFDSRARQEKKRVVGLVRGPLSLVSTTEELLGRIIAALV
jgi:hypothetical protein